MRIKPVTGDRAIPARLRDDPRRDPGAAVKRAERLPDDPAKTKRLLLETLVGAAAGTQEDMASELGISYATLHAWKTGRREIPDDALESMARLALRRSRMLMEVGSRLLRLADIEVPGQAGEPGTDDVRLAAAETRARARTMREQARETSERLRRRSSQGVDGHD